MIGRVRDRTPSRFVFIAVILSLVLSGAAGRAIGDESANNTFPEPRFPADISTDTFALPVDPLSVSQIPLRRD